MDSLRTGRIARSMLQFRETSLTQPCFHSVLNLKRMKRIATEQRNHQIGAGVLESNILNGTGGVSI